MCVFIKIIWKKARKTGHNLKYKQQSTEGETLQRKGSKKSKKSSRGENIIITYKLITK